MNLTQQRPVLSVSGHKDMSDAHSKSIDGEKKEKKNLQLNCFDIEINIFFLLCLPPFSLSKLYRNRRVANVAGK